MDRLSPSLLLLYQFIMFGRERDLLAHVLLWSGTRFLLGQLPPRDSLLVLNYHRIGNPDADLFDPGVFSATAEQFDDQIAYLKRNVSLVSLEEALAFIGGEPPGNSPRCRVLITFDDGYLDNYEVAFPILCSHGVQGAFFLVTDFVGSCSVPWWDHIAHLIKTARKQRFSLHYPTDLFVNLVEDGTTKSLKKILNLFASPENADPDRFIQELQHEAQGDPSPSTQRRFLDWCEARTMITGGMAIGSHTRSHMVLSKLSLDQQRHELVQSRVQLRERLGVEIDALAYPVGDSSSFSVQTQRLAKEAGYRAAFSFYDGTNLPGRIRPFDVKRVSVDNHSRTRFRAKATVCRHTGNYWP
jgi:peptidoglycan/xylan/chitin deacetylase (PgdA/CDA1 family)